MPMGRKLTDEEADARFEAVGLEPLEPYVGRSAERRCRCQRCRTIRRVKLSTLSRPGGVACRWCHGWYKWLPWSDTARSRALTWRAVNTSPKDSLAKIESLGLIAITPPGDEFTPVGFVCPSCGETGVAVPERIGERAYYGCQRCAQARTKVSLENAPDVFEENGLRLVDHCRGEYVPQPAECLTCGTLRNVSLADLKAGTAPLCWTCTHGIRPDEPHRIYLVHFPELQVMKIGLTHARHDRRIADHLVAGGTVISVADVLDRATARRVERLLLERYAAWATFDLCADDFPQGGWTETWSDTAPPLDLLLAVDEARR